jgi:hypothetical protein
MNKFIVEFLVEGEQDEGDGLSTYFVGIEVTSTLKATSLYDFIHTLMVSEDEEVEDTYQELIDDLYQTVMATLVKQEGWNYSDTCIIDDLNAVDAVDKSLEDDMDDEGPKYSYEYDNVIVTQDGTCDKELHISDLHKHDASVITMVS